MRGPFGRSRNHGVQVTARVLHALFALSLLVGLAMPLAPLTPPAAAAAPLPMQQGGQLPPPLPAPARVALSGSFQTALGCAADFDPSCPQTQLGDNRDGSWSAVLPVPPGDYLFRVVASSDADRSLGEGGDPNGGDIPLSVAGAATGVYFRYDSLTGEIVAEPVTNAATLVTDLGEQFAMAPAPAGGYEVRWDAQPGAYGFQVLFNGQLVAQDSVSLDSPSRVIVAVDDSGAVTVKDTLRDTRLDVTAADAGGAPRPGSCFAVLDRDGELQTQVCDVDDGQLDGLLRLRVPNGLDDGNYTLRETFTPEGVTPAADQRLDLGAGRFEAFAATTAGEPTPEEPAPEPGTEEPADQPGAIEPVDQPEEPPVTEPGEAPGRLRVIPVDAAGAPLPGACFAVVELGFEACDDDGDGAIVFDAVPSVPLTLRETAPPAGFAAVADLPVSIDPTGARLLVPHEPVAAAETPVEPVDEPPPVVPVQTPQDAVAASEVVLAARDRDGNPIPGSCWALTERGGNQTIERCDGDDGAEDSVMHFDSVPAGRYRLDEVTTPAGYQPAESQNIDVVAGVPVEVTVESRPARGQPGRLVILVADETGAPMAQTCFDVLGPVELTDVCDRQDDGQLNIPDLPAGRYTVIQTQTAAGFAPAAETSVVVPADDTIELPLVNSRIASLDEDEQEPEPGVEPEEPVVPAADGQVFVTFQADNGAPLPGACVALDDGSSVLSVCDDAAGDASGEAGRIEIGAVTTGEYILTVTPPEGFDAPGPATIQVAAGQSAPVDIVLSPVAPAAPENGSLAILAEDDAGNLLPAACYTVELPPGGQAFGPFCDEDGDGIVTVQGITPGLLAVVESAPPTDSPAADPARQEIEIIAGEEAEGIFRRALAQEDQEQEVAGTVEVRVVDAAGQPFAACVDVFNPSGDFIACDNDADDRDERTGVVRFDAVVAGTYTVELFDLPDGIAVPPSQEIEVRAGETTAVDIVLPAPEEDPPGSVEIRVVDAVGQPFAACVDVFNALGDSIACDNDGDDRDERAGVVRFDEVTPGTYTVELFDLPESIADPGAQQIDVASGELTVVEFAVAAGPGTLVIFVEDETGELIGGSCFTIQGDTEAQTLTDICDQGDDGRLNFPDLPSGDYTIIQTQAAEGRQLASEQTVTVEPGQTVEIALLNPREPETPTPVPTETPTPEPEPTPTPEPTPEPVATAAQPATTGMLSVVNLGPDGSPLGDGCFVLADANGVPVTEACDNDASDFDGTPGVIAFGGVPAGQYTLTQTAAAEGFSPAAPVTVEHGVDATFVDLVSQPAAEETGVVELAAFDDGGNPITGQCYTLAGLAGTFGPFCDNGEGDSSPDPGLLVVEGLPTGTYEAVLETALDAPDADLQVAQQARPRRSVSVRRGERPTRAVFNVRAQQRQRGDLLIRVRDEDGSYLAGACFGLIEDGASERSVEVCDNAGGDENTADGRILLTDLRAGRYTLTQTMAPDGFALAPDQAVRVAAGSVREVAVVNQAEPERTATLDVETIDNEGTLLPGACYAIMRGNSALEACDDDNGGDGITRFADIDAGSYVVRQIEPPPGGFTAAGATATRLDPGQSATVTVVNETRPGSLVLRTTDDAGQLLGDACFALLSGNQAVYSVCDNDASDANPGAGVILLGTVAPGTYTLRETQPPAGYLAAADQEVAISANQRSQVTVVNTLAPEPERSGDLRVFKVNADGRTLAGSCFALLDGDGRVVVRRCDVDDGADNGVVLMEGIAPDEYTLRETRRPSADFESAPDVLVEIIENQTVDVEVVNRLRAGRILIRKSDPNGIPLAGACFDLIEDGAGESCTNENGELVFAGLAPRIYRVIETETPPGFLTGPAIDPVTVRPGSTTTLDVVNQPAPPPPDSGSIQVRKFVCPAAAGGGGIDFVDSSDPDGGGLARTAGCDIGDAAFVLDGPSGPIEFRTGAGGRFQTTLATGDYVLTELSTGASEPLVIRVNTLTTVVVLNFVEPEGEQPAAIDVVKYTCAPGFQGRVWLDFVEGCLSAENLTSNVGYRLSGAVSARRVTGDAGAGGVTRFDGLPAGDYRLREEVPQSIVAVYAFCGLDPDSPDGRAVGDALDLRLAAGQTVTCSWFNVPEDLAGNTGAITVYKYACPVTTPPTGFDWYGRCDPQGQGVRFSLSLWDGSQFVPVITGATDGDGILRVTRLQPGIYDLQEVDAAWCYAESDSVDARGQVVVAAGERASVWIFNCVGAKNPPNTGAGPGAVTGGGESGAAMLPGPVSAAGLGLGLLWPLAGLAVLRFRGRAW